MENRKICPICKSFNVAVNYHRNGKTHYRSMCESCKKSGKKLKDPAPKWFRMGYRKKSKCELCMFVAKYNEQLVVVHLDGNLTNVDWTNLKTICLHCEVATKKSTMAWKSSPLNPDY